MTKWFIGIIGQIITYIVAATWMDETNIRQRGKEVSISIVYNAPDSINAYECTYGYVDRLLEYREQLYRLDRHRHQLL
jgi:hypothetical protein